MDTTVNLQPIGTIASCFKQKFGTPRQPGLVTAAQGRLRLLPAFSDAEVVRGLEGFSHIWLIFLFHQTLGTQWKPTVRPPRLGGNDRLGVFATRSMFRPNPLGLSVVRLEGIQQTGGCVELLLSGLDLVDGTPVVDIKPYLGYADAIMDAQSGFAATAPEPQYTVNFSPKAADQCRMKSVQWGADIASLLSQILEQDPRPAYRSGREDSRHYGLLLYDFDVRWCVSLSGIEVLELVDCPADFTSTPSNPT